MQLETEGELVVGTVMNLTLEFDHQNLPEMTCPARVVWCKTHGRSRYRAGFQFLADGPELKRQLRQVALVFQARSQADIDTLLDESRRLDEDRTQQVLQIQEPRRLGTRKREQPVAPAAEDGVFIPLGVRLTAYSWQSEASRFWLLFQEGMTEHQLLFPSCELVRDHGCAAGKPAAMLHSTVRSDLIQEVVRRAGPGPWKHYQFMADQRTVLLEVVSHPCQPAP